MPHQEIIWTLLPNGFSDDGPPAMLKLSVFVSPRLRFDDPQRSGKLGSFDDFLDWPARVLSGQFSLIVDDDQAHPKPATVVAEIPLDSALWKAIFNEETTVVSHKPGFESDQSISTYPAHAVESGISKGYAKLGEGSPYLPAPDAEVAECFPDVRRAMLPDQAAPRQSFERFKKVDAIEEADLELDHRFLSENLLRHDPEFSFSEKLTAAAAIAERRAGARKRNGTGAVQLIIDGKNQASAFAQFAAFHRRVPRSQAGARRQDDTVAEPVKDFHEIITSLAEYPILLRRLGLVIDLKISASEIPQSRRGEVRRLRLAPNLPGASPVNPPRTPSTNYLHSAAGESDLPLPSFRAAPKGSHLLPSRAVDEKLEIVAGLLNLSLKRPDDPLDQTPQFSLSQIDIDGAGLKLLNALAAIVADSSIPNRPIDKENTGAPTLRTSGLSLVRDKFASVLMADIDRADALETGLGNADGPTLFAEDLIRGYRIDVRRFGRNATFDSPGSTTNVPWHSLHKRKGTLAIPRSGLPDLKYDVIDEGFIQPAVTQDIEPEPTEQGGGRQRERTPRPLYVSESIFHWQGWGLSSPPPATPLETAHSAPLPRDPIAPGRRPIAEFESVPGTLPRLRFGQHYQIRARAVDLAGNGLSVQQADSVLRALGDAQRTQPIFPASPKDFFFRRFDPIPPPVLVLREELTEGEAPDVLVVRSNDGLSAQAYADTLGDPKYKGVNERHVVPPKSAQRMTEMHGLYENAFGANGNPASFYGICAKENGTLNDREIVNVATGLAEPLPDLIDPHSGDIIPNGLKFFEPRGSSSTYAVHCEVKLLLPYLPDPLARGASLFGLPGVIGKSGLFNDQTDQVSFVGPQVLPTSAHNALGFVTKIGFGRDWPGRLPFRLQLSDTPADSPRPLPQWDPGARLLEVKLPPGETATVWLSSFPNKADIDLFALYHWWGQHAGSSAETREFLNTAEHGALAMLSPARKVLLVHAVQKPVRLAAPSPTSGLGVVRFPKDTAAFFGGTFRIHGPSTAKLDLWAAWEEPGERGGDPVKTNIHVLELPIHPEGVSEVDAATADPKPIATYAAQHAESLQFKAPPNVASSGKYQAKQDFGDTKYRKVTYTLTATSRYLEYFPTSITNEMTRSITLVEPIRSSAPPAAPEIAGVVPILKRKEQWNLSDLVAVHREGGFRVILGSTWYSSGEGEMLALMGPMRWGLDPVHCLPAADAGIGLKPSVEGFNLGGQTVHAYVVKYDREHRAYVADITFAANDAYFRFVEPTFARYQPNSLPGMHLSPTIMTGVQQLLPRRSVFLSYPAASPGDPGRRINVTVAGKRPSAAGHLPPTHGYRVDVALEERLRRNGDDEKDLRWSAANTGQPVADMGGSLDDMTLWRGHLFVPQSDTKERRIVVREFELFPLNQGPPNQAWIEQTDAASGFSRRLVYADTIPLV